MIGWEEGAEGEWGQVKGIEEKGKEECQEGWRNGGSDERREVWKNT